MIKIHKFKGKWYSDCLFSFFPSVADDIYPQYPCGKEVSLVPQ